MITFLERLLIGSEPRACLSVDGRPGHMSAAVKRFVAEQDGRLKLIFLPPYSPHLSLDEQDRCVA